jgi:hypothetical protein
MITFKEASQARCALKMLLSNYSWYCNSVVYFDSSEYGILVNVKEINNNTRKIIPQVFNSVNIKVEVEN